MRRLLAAIVVGAVVSLGAGEARAQAVMGGPTPGLTGSATTSRRPGFMARATASPATAYPERSPPSRPIPGPPTAQTSRATVSYPAVMASVSGVPASPRPATSTERPPLGAHTGPSLLSTAPV